MANTFLFLQLILILIVKTTLITIVGITFRQLYTIVFKSVIQENSTNKISVLDKYGSIFPYWLPLVEGSMNFGQHVIAEYPDSILFLYNKNLLPLVWLYNSYPILAIVIFFLLYYLFVRLDRPINTSAFVRFNVLQALLLFLINSVLGASYRSLPIEFKSSLIGLAFTNILFWFTLSTIGYSIMKSIEGKYPKIPVISEAVRMQINDTDWK